MAKPAADTGISGHHRFGACIVGLSATTHDRQRTVFSPCLTAGHRGVNKTYAFGCGECRQFACDLRGNSCVIHKHRTGEHAGKSAICALAQTAQIIIIADACHNKIGPG